MDHLNFAWTSSTLLPGSSKLHLDHLNFAWTSSTLPPGQLHLDHLMEDYDALFEFLENRYPTDYTKNQKQCLRRKAQEHFQTRNGILYYSKEPANFQGSRGWKHVPRSLTDKERILKACHDNNAQGKTTIQF